MLAFQDIVIPHVVWDDLIPARVGPLKQFHEDFLDTEDPIPGAHVEAPPLLPDHVGAVDCASAVERSALRPHQLLGHGCSACLKQGRLTLPAALSPDVAAAELGFLH